MTTLTLLKKTGESVLTLIFMSFALAGCNRSTTESATERKPEPDQMNSQGASPSEPQTATNLKNPDRSCDPNYSPCVPIASDVDCAGGAGNGPAYVRGPVRVIGTDIYELDRDGDGVGCEK